MRLGVNREDIGSFLGVRSSANENDWLVCCLPFTVYNCSSRVAAAELLSME